MNSISLPAAGRWLRTLGVTACSISLFACGGGSGGSTTTGGGGAGGGTPPPTPNEILYVASGNNGQGQILAFPVSASGQLGASSAFNAPQYLFEMKADAAGKFLYASDFDMGAMRAYSIQNSTGALSEVAGSPFVPSGVTGNGGPFAITPDGKFLFYCVYGTSGDISTFSVSSGTLTPTGAVAHDDGQPFEMSVDPTGKYLYVTDHGDNMVNGQVSAFSIDSTGALAEVVGSPFEFHSDNNEEPVSLAIHPNGKFVYVSLTGADSGVDGAEVNTATGALTLIPGSPFVTGSRFAPGYMAMVPAGKNLYVSGNGSVSAVAIDQSTGKLTAINTLTSDNPAQIVVDGAGKFLFGSLPGFKTVGSYPIDQTTGSLGDAVTYPAGADPGALAIVRLQ
jgi:6-phosphogluconolactonase